MLRTEEVVAQVMLVARVEIIALTQCAVPPLNSMLEVTKLVAQCCATPWFPRASLLRIVSNRYQAARTFSEREGMLSGKELGV